MHIVWCAWSLGTAFWALFFPRLAFKALGKAACSITLQTRFAQQALTRCVRTLVHTRITPSPTRFRLLDLPSTRARARSMSDSSAEAHAADAAQTAAGDNVMPPPDCDVHSALMPVS